MQPLWRGLWDRQLQQKGWSALFVPACCARGSCTNRIEIKRKTLEDFLLARLKTELESPEVMDYIAQELRRRVDEAHSRPQERQRLTKELDAERRKLQNLVAALEDGRSSATILEAVRKREANIQRLQQDLTALGRERRAIPITPEWIRTQLKDLSSLLTESGERARTAFRKLSLDIRLHPVRPEGERPHLRAVATANLAALTGDFTLVDRSKEPSIQRWKLSFAADLPPNLKIGRWREQGRRRP
jgi:hypothetical protein